MLKTILSILSLLLGYTAMCQDFHFDDQNKIVDHHQNYFACDPIYVVAASGLNLRREPNTSSNVLGKIKFNEEIIFLEGTAYYDEIENRKGSWIKVKNAMDLEGYLFSGYTSKVKYPEDLEIRCQSITGINKLLQVNEDSMIRSSQLMFDGDLRGAKESYMVRVKSYDHGTTINLKIGYEWAEVLLETYFLTQNDVLNYLNHYIKRSNDICSSSPYYEAPQIIVEKDKWGRRVRRVYLKPEHIYSFESVAIGDKLLVRYYSE